MEVEPLGLQGVSLLHGTRHRDDRGDLAKIVEVDVLRASGVLPAIDQVLTATNAVAGTVRGMHYQVAPHEETKVLWVTRGRLHDVLVDLRPDEPTFGRALAVDLTGDDELALLVPPGVAHGYQTLEDETSVAYLIAGQFSAADARTLRWDDPTVAIDWPRGVTRVSGKDQEGHGWPPPG